MANRADNLAGRQAPRALQKARADLSRAAADATDSLPAEAPMAAAVDTAGFPARLDLMRARLAKAREDAISALLFLGDARQDCDALAEICQAAGWSLTASGVELLNDALRRAIPSEPRHLDLVRLLIDALYALRRAEARPEMGKAAAELLHGLSAAVRRELGDGHA